jgi:multiple sugar transport system permease protein
MLGGRKVTQLFWNGISMTSPGLKSILPGPIHMTDQLRGYLFVLPCILLLVLVLGFPALTAVVNSFTPLWSPESTFTLTNYTSLLGDKLFWNALFVTIVFVAGTVGLHVVLGMIVALALNSAIRARSFFQIIAILPWTVPDVISGLVWRFMYNPTSGVINHFLMQVGLTDRYIEWLTNPNLALFSVILADVWRGYPFVMIILLAGLKAIPTDYYEAAEVDGANAVQRFIYITIPGLSRVMYVALALDIIWQMRRFGLMYNMTLGGPGHATEILSLYIYKHYFKYFNFEYASAMAVVMAVVMLAISFPYIRMISRGEK